MPLVRWRPVFISLTLRDNLCLGKGLHLISLRLLEGCWMQSGVHHFFNCRALRCCRIQFCGFWPHLSNCWWPSLREGFRLSYLPSLPNLRKAAFLSRRISRFRRQRVVVLYLLSSLSEQVSWLEAASFYHQVAESSFRLLVVSSRSRVSGWRILTHLVLRSLWPSHHGSGRSSAWVVISRGSRLSHVLIVSSSDTCSCARPLTTIRSVVSTFVDMLWFVTQKSWFAFIAGIDCRELVRLH